MSLYSVGGEVPNHDVRERIAAGTIGGEHATPGSFRGKTLTTVVQPFDARITYGGSWSVAAGGDALDFLGESAFSTLPGSNISLAFNGTSVSVIGRTQPSGGRADVYVDGVLQAGRVNTFTTLPPGTYGIAGLNATDTSITLALATSFTSSGTIQIDGEQITYSGKSVNTLTGCTRGANGTAAATHVTGTTVYGYSSLVEFYSAYIQPRVTLWSNTTLTPGEHILKLVVRSDADPSSTSTTNYVNCFVVGGAIGASNLITHWDYVTYPSLSFSSGYTPINNSLSTVSTDQQILGIVGAVASDSGTLKYCGVSVNPTTGALGFYAPQVGSGGTGTADVIVTITVLGAPL